MLQIYFAKRTKNISSLRYFYLRFYNGYWVKGRHKCHLCHSSFKYDWQSFVKFFYVIGSVRGFVRLQNHFHPSTTSDQSSLCLKMFMLSYQISSKSIYSFGCEEVTKTNSNKHTHNLRIFCVIMIFTYTNQSRVHWFICKRQT